MYAYAAAARRSNQERRITLPAFGSSNPYSSNGFGFGDTSTFASPPVATPSSPAYANDGFYKDKPRNKKLQTNLGAYTVLGVVAFFFIGWMMHSRAQRAWLLKEMRVQSIEEAIHVFKNLKNEHRNTHSDLQFHVSHRSRMDRRDDAWRLQTELLKNATKREARRSILDKFGPGPHRVAFDIQLPHTSRTERFAVEMAPIQLVPHAVHVFLEQVAHGLWNNSIFLANHAHVLQAAPADREHREKFADYELDRLAYPDYSDEFPHDQWTLGFAGRPGGPSWYINKLDNEDSHGPYGQDHHALDEFADSCFGKVVTGFDVLNKVFDNDDTTLIVSVFVMDWEDHWTDEKDSNWHQSHEDSHDSDYMNHVDDDFYREDQPSSSTSVGTVGHTVDASHPSPNLVEGYYGAHHIGRPNTDKLFDRDAHHQKGGFSIPHPYNPPHT